MYFKLYLRQLREALWKLRQWKSPAMLLLLTFTLSTDKRTDKSTDKRTHKSTDKRTDKSTDKRTDKSTDKRTRPKENRLNDCKTNNLSSYSQH